MNSAGNSGYTNIVNATTANSTTTTSSPPPVGGCSAVYAQTNAWPGGFQGQVTVTNTGTNTTTGWTVVMTFANGQQHHPDLGRPHHLGRQPLHRHQRDLERQPRREPVHQLRLPR